MLEFKETINNLQDCPTITVFDVEKYLHNRGYKTVRVEQEKINTICITLFKVQHLYVYGNVLTKETYISYGSAPHLVNNMRELMNVLRYHNL